MREPARRAKENVQTRRTAAASCSRGVSQVRQDSSYGKSSYFAAAAEADVGAAAATARRSFFCRRFARFFALSLPLLCPIQPHQTRSRRQYQGDSVDFARAMMHKHFPDV